MQRCTGRAYRRELWPLAVRCSPLLLICCCGLIAVMASSFGFTTGEYGKVQIFVNLADVVVPEQSWQGLSGVMRNWCQAFGTVSGGCHQDHHNAPLTDDGPTWWMQVRAGVSRPLVVVSPPVR